MKDTRDLCWCWCSCCDFDQFCIWDSLSSRCVCWWFIFSVSRALNTSLNWNDVFAALIIYGPDEVLPMYKKDKPGNEQWLVTSCWFGPSDDDVIYLQCRLQKCVVLDGDYIREQRLWVQLIIIISPDQSTVNNQFDKYRKCHFKLWCRCVLGQTRGRQSAPQRPLLPQKLYYSCVLYVVVAWHDRSDRSRRVRVHQVVGQI